MGVDAGGSVGIGVGTIDGSGDGAGVGENVSTKTLWTDEDDIVERRRPDLSATSSSAETDPSRRWPRSVAKSIIAAVNEPSALDAFSTLPRAVVRRRASVR